ncbi:DNA cytosine methyltransferase [Kitasatospora sp. GP82]|uniref:DNA cytosine methyltransferase n=1 Tax=Kitasatospora sp. GP82 TaxID=3035089 RepID=UPI0024752E4B|nr:DNA cytosine methyltransferase [Kitasatospora sp. GP82]MDH6123642.1 DNA (cytosine-5)-methyltransferase 1 [Kitasatospora sp. GP82]
MGDFYGVPLERSDYLALGPHEQSCTPETFAAWVESLKGDELLAVDLFSGAGGLSLGLKRAGWTVAAAVDFNERALETHAANFPGLSLHMDLGDPDERARLVEILKPAKIDLVAGGPPCQPFSRAGRSKIRSLVEKHGRDPQDLRKELWNAYLDIVMQLKPRAVLMENVPDMGLSDDFRVIRIIEERLEDCGYATQVRLADAWNYGVPQHRKRLILHARNDLDRFEWPEAQKSWTTVRDAIGDLPSLPPFNKGARVLPYSKPRKASEFVSQMRKDAPRGKIWDHMTRGVREDDMQIYEGMTSKTLYTQVPEELRRYKADNFTDKYKRLDWEELSRTITAHIAKDGYWYIHPEQHRTLTVREAARIQTFPDDFRFAGVRSDAFRQIGNAVPPMLGQAAAEVLLPVDGVEAPAGGLTPYWREVRATLTDWAQRQRNGGDWYHLPAAKARPVHAAVAAVLSGAKVKSGVLAEVFGIVRTSSTLTSTMLAKMIALAPSSAAVKRLERLTPLVDNVAAWRKLDDVPELLQLKPAELALFRLLSGQDLLLIGQGSLRVAARVNDSTAHQTNRLSDGRVNMVKLVGAGDDAPLRMAALRLIGANMCHDSEPVCGSCPLRTYCPQRETTLLDDDMKAVVTE